jgi:hypothetical protein
VRLGEVVLRYALGPDAVAALDLVEIGGLRTGEHSCVGAEATELLAEPAGALLAQPCVRKLVQEHVGVSRKLRRRSHLLLCCDRLGKFGRPVVGIDEPVHVPAEPQPEGEIALDERHRSKSAAWPCPTPTHIVATP